MYTATTPRCWQIPNSLVMVLRQFIFEPISTLLGLNCKKNIDCVNWTHQQLLKHMEIAKVLVLFRQHAQTPNMSPNKPWCFVYYPASNCCNTESFIYGFVISKLHCCCVNYILYWIKGIVHGYAIRSGRRPSGSQRPGRTCGPAGGCWFSEGHLPDRIA